MIDTPVLMPHVHVHVVCIALHLLWSLPHAVSSVTASIDVVSGRLGTFRVRCDSSGGRALSMSVTGPDAFSEDLNSIQAVGTPQRRGSDSFSDSTDIISEGSDGQTYVCTASNGVSSDPTDSVELRGDCWIQSHAYTCEHAVTADGHHVSLYQLPLQLLILQP